MRLSRRRRRCNEKARASSTAVGGSEEFFDQEVVPCVRHLTRLENSGDSWRHLTKRTLRFMLFHERRQTEFKKWDLVQNF